MNTATLDREEDEEESKEGAPPPPQDFRSETQAFLFSRMIAYGRRIRGSTMAKPETHKLDGGERVVCHVIRFSSANAQHELWVHQRRFYVLQWMQGGMVRYGDRPIKTKITMKVKKIRLGRRSGRQSFRFQSWEGVDRNRDDRVPLREPDAPHRTARRDVLL